MLGACGALIGIQDIGVDGVATKPHDGGIDADAGVQPVEMIAEGGVPDVYIPPPQMLEAGTASRRVFLTSMLWRGGSLGGVSGATTLCNSAASSTKPPLGGSWVPWISDQSMNAPERLSWPGPYVTVNNVLVAQHKTDLTNPTATLAYPINIQENGVQLQDDKPFVWTGTHGDGQGSANCGNWTNMGPGQIGTLGAFNQTTNPKWTDLGGQPFTLYGAYDCNNLAHLYCFEQM